MRFGRGRLGRGRSFTPSEPDWLAEQVSGLAAGESTGNILPAPITSVFEIRRNDSGFAAYYTAPGCTTISPGAVGEDVGAYCCLAYVPHLGRWLSIGGGGHGNGLDTAVFRFNDKTGTWERTEDSGKVSNVANDPEPEGLPFLCQDGNGWRTWRNADGKFTSHSMHLYGDVCYLPDIDKVWRHGGASFSTGTGGPGGAIYVDATTGKYEADETAWAGVPSQNADITALYVPTIFVVDGSGNKTGTSFSGLFRTWENRSGWLLRPSTKEHIGGISFNSALGARECTGCLIPDPDYPGEGYLAHISYADADRMAIMNRINRTNGTTSNLSTTQYKNWGNEAPANFGRGRFIYMGDYIPGCEKVAALAEGDGLYMLDLADFTWSEKLADWPFESGSLTGGVLKRFEYVARVGCFAFWDDDYTELYALKLPEAFAA